MHSSCSKVHIVPAMASKGWPCKRRAPRVNLDHFVQSIEVGLETHKLMQISIIAAPLVCGWDFFCKSNNITDAIMGMNQYLLTSSA